MSQENVELAHRAFDAINRRDLDALMALVDADVQSAPLMSAIEGDYRGHDGFRRLWKDLDVFPDVTIEAVEVRDLGDVTLAHLRTRGHGAGSDTPVGRTLWSVGEWRDGKVVWWSNHGNEAEALGAVGLRE